MWHCNPLPTLLLAHLVTFVAPAGVSDGSFHPPNEADYTLDDSFWNEESPVGEVERLLREYRQNQELVRRIGSHYYQIIYPVQLRHHEKMGISTREVSSAKVRNRIHKRNSVEPTSPPRNYDSGPYPPPPRGRTRTGKHFHRTSLLIKAFNHKFRLDLELNSQLLSPNIQQKHYHANGYSTDSGRHDIEHCYYHGTVKDYPGASAAFHTCQGVSGVIHIGNETFVIHPFYGGDLTKHPHVIFEARTKSNKGCANSGTMDWRVGGRRQKASGIVGERDDNGGIRFKRDVREATKYIETAIIVDKAMFDKRNGSTRAEVIHDAIQVANIADLYFRTLNTRVSVVYIETWAANQAQIEGGKDISKAISSFNDYTSRKLFKVDKDTTQLLTGETFIGGEAGMAAPETVCTPKAVGISVDINVYEPHLLAGTMAHMIGHNIGMGHDDGRDECFCRDWHGCIMSQSIVGLESVQPYKFSECSKKDYIDALRTGNGLCLLNKPNELEMRRNCGNKIVEDDEECDCGSLEECAVDSCCDGITCKLKKESECANGECCDNCKLKGKGYICRDSQNECDLAESCTGTDGQCPADAFKKNGSPCGPTKSADSSGYCFNGDCPTLNIQCERIWGYGASSADLECFSQFNTKGSISGHCGIDGAKNFFKCDTENILCGSLQCRDGERTPTIEGLHELYTKTIISTRGIEFECKATSESIPGFPSNGLVLDGTPCGENLVCVNQTCVSLFPYIDQTKCPTNQNNLECSGHGFCTNNNRCYCDFAYSGPDCSFFIEMTTAAPTEATQAPDTEIKMEKKETHYENYHGSNTVFLVGVLMSIVGFVFVTFTLMALCYRRKTTRLKYDPPYTKKPSTKTYGGAATANHHSVEEVSLDGSAKLMTYAGGFRDHKIQQIRRMTGSGSEDDPTHSGDETVTFIDHPPKNLSKLPEKGILKKHGYGLMVGDQCKEKWGDDGQSDNLELSQQQDGTGASGASEVERTLKSLNGYHEDILEALRNAASHRGTPVNSGSLTEEIRKLTQECGGMPIEYKRSSSKSSSRENICDMQQPHINMLDGSASNTLLHHHRQAGTSQQHIQDEDDTPTTGPLRIRNLEDLIRQLEHHSSRHMSPSGSEDIRMSETEADRHYRLDSSAACSESSQGSNQQLAQSQKTATILPSYSSRCRPRSDDEGRFMYGRYRHPQQQNRHAPHQTHSPHTFGHHTHHSHAHGHSSHGPHSSHHSSHTHLHQDDEGIYETADHHDRQVDTRVDRDTPDSESDDFIQAQQQLARWASEDVVSVVVLEPESSSLVGMHQDELGLSQTATIHGDHPSAMQALAGLNVGTRDYYPSPPSTETESSGSVIQPQPLQRCGHIDPVHGAALLTETPGRYPEYKH